MKPLKKKIKTFVNLKGGVGKSTLASQFALFAAARGYQTLCIDLDPQAHLTKILLFEDHELGELDTMRDRILTVDAPEMLSIPMVRENLHLIGANLSLSTLDMELYPKNNREKKVARAIQSVSPAYDLVVIDTNPSASLINLCTMIASDELVVVTATDRLSSEGMASLFHVLEQLTEDFPETPPPPVRIVANLHRPRERMAEKSLAYLQINYGDILLPAVVRKWNALKECQSFRNSIFEYDSASKACADIEAMTEALLKD